MKYLLPLLGLLLIACAGGNTRTAENEAELMEQEVRYYLFLDDSVDVNVTINDTITKGDLDTLIATIEENLELIQMDIDTLESIVDTMAYQNMEKQNGLTCVMQLLTL